MDRIEWEQLDAQDAAALVWLNNSHINTAARHESVLARSETRQMNRADDESARRQKWERITEVYQAMSDTLDTEWPVEIFQRYESVSNRPLWREGQCILQWWAPWMKDAKEILFPVYGNDRPAWYVGVVMAHIGVQSMQYGGVTRKLQHCYQIFNPNGIREVVPEQFLLEHTFHHLHNHGLVQPDRQEPIPEFWLKEIRNVAKKSKKTAQNEFRAFRTNILPDQPSSSSTEQQQ